MRNKRTKILQAVCAGVVAQACTLGPALYASELVYEPVNPSFGGSPLNGSYLLNSALATRKHQAPDVDSDRYSIEERSPTDQLNDAIERSLLNRLAMAASSGVMDANGNFIPGELETANYRLSIEDAGGGRLIVTTIDKITGNSTTFEIFQ